MKMVYRVHQQKTDAQNFNTKETSKNRFKTYNFINNKF